LGWPKNEFLLFLLSIDLAIKAGKKRGYGTDIAVKLTNGKGFIELLGKKT